MDKIYETRMALRDITLSFIIDLYMVTMDNLMFYPWYPWLSMVKIFLPQKGEKC